MPQVVVIWSENTGLAATQSQTLEHQLSLDYQFCTNISGVGNPSLPNYLGMSGGTTFGVTCDFSPHGQFTTTNNIFSQCAANGKTWKTYEEGLYNQNKGSGQPYWTGANLAYKHNPGDFYSYSYPKQDTPTTPQGTVNTRSDFLGTNGLTADINSGQIPADFSWITGNLNNCGHDTNITFFDNWLQGLTGANGGTSYTGHFPGLAALQAAMRPDGIIIIGDDSPPNPVYYCFVTKTKPVPHPANYTTAGSHYSVLYAIQRFLFGTSPDPRWSNPGTLTHYTYSSPCTSGTDALNTNYLNAVPPPLVPSGSGTNFGQALTVARASVPSMAERKASRLAQSMTTPAASSVASMTGVKRSAANTAQAMTVARASVPSMIPVASTGLNYAQPLTVASATSAKPVVGQKSTGRFVNMLVQLGQSQAQAIAMDTSTASAGGATSVSVVPSNAVNAGDVMVAAVSVVGANLAGTTLTDTFSRTVGGGLGSADSGQAWSIDQAPASQYAVNGSAAVVSAVQGTAPIAHLPVGMADCEAVARFQVTASSQSFGVQQSIGLALRLSDVQNYFRCIVDLPAGGGANLKVQRQVANVNTDIISSTPVGPVSAGTYWWMRFRVTGYPAMVQAKFWQDGTTEPAAFQYVATDSAAAGNTTGFPGLRLQWVAGMTSGSSSILMDNYQATDLASGVSAPSGWALRGSTNDGANLSTGVYSRLAGANESTNTYTWTAPSSATGVMATMLSGGGIDPVNPVRSVGVAATAGTRSMAPAATVVPGAQAGDELVLIGVSDTGPRPWTDTGCALGIMPNPTAWSTQADGGGAATDGNVGIGTLETVAQRKFAFAHSMVPWDCSAGATGNFNNGAYAPTEDFGLQRMTYMSWPRPRTAPGGNDWNSVFGSGKPRPGGGSYTGDPFLCFQDIAAGKYNALIDGNATAWALYGHPLLCRLFWEIDGGGIAWGVGNSTTAGATFASTFIQAWRLIVTRVRAIAPNVLFHFNPQSRPASGSPNIDVFWPGSAYVDSAGTEGYMSVGDTFTTPLTLGTGTTDGKGVYADYGPTGTVAVNNVMGNGEGGNRWQGTTADAGPAANRTTSIGTNIASYPAWKNYIWWNGTGSNGDSRINNQPAACQTAFQNFGALAYMKPAFSTTFKSVPAGWVKIGEARNPLGSASVKTNFGPGMCGQIVLHKSVTTSGDQTTPALATYGFGHSNVVGIALQPAATNTGGTTGSISTQLGTGVTTWVDTGFESGVVTAGGWSSLV